MISYACPNCHGALYIEVFRADQHKYAEFICLNCARLWKAEKYPLIALGHALCCTEATRQRIEVRCKAYVQREAPWLLQVKVEVDDA